MNTKTLSVVSRFHFVASWNGWQQDLRTRITLWISLALLLGLSAAGTLWLVHQLSLWQMEGVAALRTHLWTTLLLIWCGLGALTVIGAMQAGFASNEARLLMTLPITPADHFRILFGLVLVEQSGFMVMLLILSMGIPLILTLGVAGLGWLLLLILGAAAATWLSLVGLILFLRYGLPHPRRVLWPALLGLLAIEGVSLLFGLDDPWREDGVWPSPWPFIWAVMALLAAAWSLLADWGGRHYMAAFQVVEGRGRSGIAFTLPGLHRLLAPLLRQRTLTASLLARAILEQNRHPLALPRIAVLPVYLLLFGLLRPRLHTLGFSEASAAAATGALMGGLILIEYGLAYALSGEGARLAIYLTAPLRTGNLLRAKLLAVLPPVMIIGWLAVIAMSAGTSASTAELILAAGTTTLFLVGVTGFVVWAGAGDVDLSALPTSSAEMLLQEELPVTPRRLQLLGFSFVILAVAIGLLWWLPPVQVLAAAVVICFALLWGGWRLAQSGMNSLVA